MGGKESAMQSQLSWKSALQQLDSLQMEWEAKVGELVEHGPGWLQGVEAGVQIGRNRIAERAPTSLEQLNVLLNEWESIGKTKTRKGNDWQAVLDGIDHGIALVVDLVREHFSLRKPPVVANGHRHKATRGRNP
jgi:hypothetical protein